MIESSSLREIARAENDGITYGPIRTASAICTAVALYQGYETEATPEGVAYATTRTVVISSLAVLGMDFVLTALMFSTT